jgi:hypothetical protein
LSDAVDRGLVELVLLAVRLILEHQQRRL